MFVLTDHRSLVWVREQTVQKEEGERVWGGTKLFPPILCRIHLRRVAQYKLQILKNVAGHYISRDRLDLHQNFPSSEDLNKEGNYRQITATTSNPFPTLEPSLSCLILI